MPPLWVSEDHPQGAPYDGYQPTYVIVSPSGSDTVPSYKIPQDKSVFYDIPNGTNVTLLSNKVERGLIQVNIPMELYVPTKYIASMRTTGRRGFTVPE